MKNYEIVNARAVVLELADRKLYGTTKFKMFRLLKQLDELAEPIIRALQATERGSQEWREIEEVEQEVNLPRLTEAELEPLEMSLLEISRLEKLIDFEGGEE